ncbi:MAG TPA: hypothetical protein VFP72_23895 [Kineosporiaceae bacterium]|nr:hypothetical protein [Kineosporiaceae bacterium]
MSFVQYDHEGLTGALQEHFAKNPDNLADAWDPAEEPRRLDEILQAEQELADRVHGGRLLAFRRESRTGQDGPTPEMYRVALGEAERVRAHRPDLRPCETEFEWGMWNGKLSALRWILGEEWDSLHP